LFAYPSGEALTRLIALGCDVNARGQNGMTPLMRAISSYTNQDAADPDSGEPGYYSWSKARHLETAEILLKAGADPDAVDDKGFSAVNYAGPKEQDAVYDLLIRYGSGRPKPEYRETSAGTAGDAKRPGAAALLGWRALAFVLEHVLRWMKRR
jgi:FOG: Ankyrin repeat